MLTILLVAVFGIVASLGQASYGSDSDKEFEYWGCAEVDPTGFDPPIQFIDDVSPEACQAVCAGQLLAAISPDGCRCGNNSEAIMALDEGACDHPCSEDPNSPMCGGSCKETVPPISNIFVIRPILVNDEDTVPAPANPPTPPNDVSSLLPTPIQTAASADPVETSREPLDPSPPENEVTQVPSVPGDVQPSLTENSVPEVATVSISSPEVSSSISVGTAEQTPPAPPITAPSVESLPSSIPTDSSAPITSGIPVLPSEPPPESAPVETIQTPQESSLNNTPQPIPTTLVVDNDPTPSVVLVSGSGVFEVPSLTNLAKLVLVVAIIA